MVTDPTFHTVWHNDKPFAVSAYPFGPRAGSGVHWSVQTMDGQWHIVFTRESGIDSAEEWQRAEALITDWLADFYQLRRPQSQ